MFFRTAVILIPFSQKINPESFRSRAGRAADFCYSVISIAESFKIKPLLFCGGRGEGREKQGQKMKKLPYYTRLPIWAGVGYSCK